MSATISLTKAARKDIARLDPAIARDVLDRLAEVATTGIDGSQKANIRALHGGGFRLRVRRNWRVVFEFHGDTLTVYAVNHRGKSYR